MALKPKRTRTTAEATKAGLRVFLAGIPWRLNEDALWRDFSECGTIEDLFLLKDASGNSRGRAFIQFRDTQGAQAALAYNETDYGGRMLYAKLAEEKREESFEQAAHEKKHPRDGTGADVEAEELKPEGCTALCFKGIGAATADDLRSALPGCDIQAIRIVNDRDTGKPRGIAFVDFVSTQDVDTAMSLDCIISGQQAIRSYEVPKVKPRPEGCLSVVVKPLGPQITNDEVKTLFRPCKKSIADVRVIRNKNLECTGLAFVDFHDGAAVERAVKLSGLQFQGKTVFVGYETKSRKLREDEREGKPRSKKKPKQPEADDKHSMGVADMAKDVQSEKKRKGGQRQQQQQQSADEAAATSQAAQTSSLRQLHEAAAEIDTKKKKRMHREPEKTTEAAPQASAAEAEGDGEEVLEVQTRLQRKRKKPKVDWEKVR